MAVPIRFPWGLLLSVLGFAAFAAAAGYFMLTDYHGQLMRRCLLHAAGGALLGAAGWRYSERLTDFVNLHSGPLLRLALPGVAAVWAATQLAGVFSELTVGIAGWWPLLLAPLLFFAVGIAPLLAGVALIAGLETALAARRGGVGVLDSVRPIARHWLIGLLVAAALIYAGSMMPGELLRRTVALAPDGTRASGWLERERTLFTEVDQDWNCEVLVLPFEAAAPSVDRAARSLMTRLVAAELAARSGLCVADPTLVARALGTRSRTHAQRTVEALATKVGAQWLVRGQIRMEPQRPAFNVALRVARRPGGQGGWSAAEETVWGPLLFSDELPPEAAFARVAHEAAAGIGIALQPAEPVAADPQEKVNLPSSVDLLPAEAPSPLTRARGLQLLALLHHPADVDGEHLWERSLVALGALPAQDETARVLRARAALHLQRRPYALQLLDGLAGPEARALRALADGHLVQADSFAAELRDAARLPFQLELHALRTRYLASGGERRQALLDAYPGYAALLYPALAGNQPPGEEAYTLIAEQLAALGLGVTRGRLESLAARVGLELLGRASLAANIERGRSVLWREHGPNWRAARAFDRVAVWDVADALHAANRRAVIAHARSMQAAAPGELLAFTLALGPSWSGYPPLEGAAAVALLAQAGAGGDARDMERARRLPRDVLAWEDGESEVERELRARLPVAEAVAPDEPPRAWRRPAPPAAALAAESAVLQGQALHFARVQQYAQHDFTPLARAIELYSTLGQRERSAQLEEQARNRFVGSPVRERFLLERAEAARDLATVIAVLQESMRQQPEQWQTYRQLAHAYLRAQEPEQAQRALLAYPGFNASAKEATVQAAAEAGAALMAAGEGERARPLLSYAGRASIDSAARVRSRMALAQLDGAWRQAQAQALELHERYAEEGALARAATLSFLVGEKEAGWRGFYEASKRFENSGPWLAALDGHRLETTKPDEAIAFAKRWKTLSGDRGREARLRAQFLFNLLLVDRPASDWAMEALNEVAAEDAPMRTLAASYAAFRRGDYAKVLEPLGVTPSAAPALPDAAALPWAALALTQTTRAAEAVRLLQSASQTATRDFHGLLASAYLAGGQGRPEAALPLLWDAFLAIPVAPAAIVPPGYQLLEGCERLYALTGDERFRLLLLDLARRMQRAWPASWAFAFDARHAGAGEEAERALGAAVFLDPQSEHLLAVPPERRERAAERYEKVNPYRVSAATQ